MDIVVEKINNLLIHIRNVQNNCNKIALTLMTQKRGNRTDYQFARQLMANGQIHDNSKFFGIEFKVLNKWNDKEVSPEMLEAAVHHHIHVNPHHPEYWGSIHSMPDIYVAEMVCDWEARSRELKSELLPWVESVAMEKFKFNHDDRIYNTIYYYFDLLMTTN